MRQTRRRHRDNIWVLGGEVISRLQMDSDLRGRPIEQGVLTLIGDDGGPLLSHGRSEAEQRSFDATCRKLFRFLTKPWEPPPRAKLSTGDQPKYVVDNACADRMRFAATGVVQFTHDTTAARKEIQEVMDNGCAGPVRIMQLISCTPTVSPAFLISDM